MKSTHPTRNFRRTFLLAAASGGAALAAGLHPAGSAFLKTANAQNSTQTRASSNPKSLLSVTSVYPSLSAANWPMWIASRAGYFNDEGVDAKLIHGLHPAGMAALVGGESQFTVYGLEQVLTAIARQPSLVIPASYLNRGAMSMIATKNIRSVADLRGKRIGIGRIGDPLYTHTTEMLARVGIAPNQVTWVSSGTDSAVRAPMLLNGQLDASLMVAPSYFRLLETDVLHELENLINRPSAISNVIVFSKAAIAAMPQLPEAVIRASSRGVKRLYEDREFSIDTFRAFNRQAQEKDVARLWDMYANAQSFNRVPMVRNPVLEISIGRVEKDVPAIRKVPTAQYIDNSIVRRLIDQGFFEQLYGPAIKDEQDAALREAI